MDTPWSGFTVTGITGVDSLLGRYVFTHDESGNGIYLNLDGPPQDDPGTIFRLSGDGIWIMSVSGAYFFTANALADWPWEVASWTAEPGSAGGSPVFSYLLAPPVPFGVPNTDPLVRAKIHVYGDEASSNAISSLTAVTPGTGGNSIRFRQIKPETHSAAPFVSVSGKDITFSLGTDSAGNSNTTCNQRNALLNADPAASMLIVATNYTGGDGTGICTSLYGFANLYGGTGHYPESPDGVPVPSADATVAATLRTSGDTASDAKALLTAMIPGRVGNAIRVRQVNPGPNHAFGSVTVDGLDITINLATDSDGTIITHGVERNAIIGDDVRASALIRADNLSGNTGLGIVSEWGFTSLSGGSGGLAPPPTPLNI